MHATVILPECSNDAISEWLRDLTKAVCRATGDSGAGGLGGSYGYGSNYENDVFMLHRYCWCDRPECAWCRSCGCGDDYETNPCVNCREQPEHAPNFLHKPTGATVHWHKYIGRGMKVSEADWPTIFAECFRSIQAT